MNIYSVSVSPNEYQWISPNVDDSEILNYSIFDGTKKKGSWSDQIEWYILNPKKKSGNIYSLNSTGAFAFDKNVYESELLTILEIAGEILSINIDNKTFYILNILDCINCLDTKKTNWAQNIDGSKGRILKHRFHQNRLSESSVFKIPETAKSEILTSTGLKNPMDEFKNLYETLGFTGLTFDKLH